MDRDILKIIKEKGTKATYPQSIEPMLCTLVKEPMDDPDFVHEVKWDGYRIIAFSRNGPVKLSLRSGLDYTNKYPPVVKALKAVHNHVHAP